MPASGCLFSGAIGNLICTHLLLLLYRWLILNFCLFLVTHLFCCQSYLYLLVLPFNQILSPLKTRNLVLLSCSIFNTESSFRNTLPELNLLSWSVYMGLRELVLRTFLFAWFPGEERNKAYKQLSACILVCAFSFWLLC